MDKKMWIAYIQTDSCINIFMHEYTLRCINRPVFSNSNIQYWNDNYTIEKIAEKIDILL